MWNLKCGTNELIYKTETVSETERIDLWFTRGRERDGLGSLGLVDAICTFRMDKQQGPVEKYRELYSITYDKPEWKRI